MARDDDPFWDVRGQLGAGLGGGCLSGPGLEEHGKATTKMAGDGTGMDVVCSCDNCGQPNKVTVSWDEMIYCSVGAVPPQWKYHPQQRALYPNVGCRACNNLLLLTFTPAECGRHLEAGKNAGYLRADYIANGQATVRQRMQAQMQR